ncbi:MAG TPA: type III pantothenate kinase [Bacteroidales bacterium]|nr:type III pantothenate kinase [Bacteroidales bacterium]
MNLVADIGNTTVKLAVYKSELKEELHRFESLDKNSLNDFICKHDIDKAIISSVKDIPGFITEVLGEKVSFLHILSARSKLPFAIDYETPETLGSDRIAGIAGAFMSFPGKDCLIIDAGSAITFDFLINGRFKGGNISPGIEMRFRALNAFTGRLPKVQITSTYTFPALNTHDAVAAGVISGVIYEINEYIRTFEQLYDSSIIIITGGDSGFLKDRIADKPVYMPDIVIDGLNFILEYNAK